MVNLQAVNHGYKEDWMQSFFLDLCLKSEQKPELSVFLTRTKRRK
ncbi:hypothetical protein HOLDEFILI_02004 [Holdemania filiformis DSM 12042]|uniref:Uncharacterized protein n=1 Tax=Holdemania filiformis DSM 12042 TaxID=545696 RepID=B9Y857_9FIRM|nr:hypothetical protein HOLDEFILI_02004 [Holdemania filiformis DSM 12042]